MSDTALSLDHFRTNAYSQAGEDGVLTEIFDRLGVTQGTFCEFGAWDGQHLSNTFAFYKKGWGGWYIEGEADRVEDLRRNVTAPNVENIQAWVRRTGTGTLDNLLTGSKLYRDGTLKSLDLLSIDIDSDDLAIWKSVKAFRPKVVIIEINPTIPIDVFFENPEGEFKGNSARSTYEFARSQGYGLVASTACNLIFVDTRLAHQPLPILDLTDLSLVLGTRYFFGYDGSLIVKQANDDGAHQVPDIIRVPWNGARFAQPVARSFRTVTHGKKMRRLWHFFSRVRLTLMHPIATLTGRVHRS
jgi:hypothetical protein